MWSNIRSRLKTSSAICRICIYMDFISPQSEQSQLGCFWGGRGACKWGPTNKWQIWLKAGDSFNSYCDDGVSENFAKGKWSNHDFKNCSEISAVAFSVISNSACGNCDLQFWSFSLFVYEYEEGKFNMYSPCFDYEPKGQLWVTFKVTISWKLFCKPVSLI